MKDGPCVDLLSVSYICSSILSRTSLFSNYDTYQQTVKGPTVRKLTSWITSFADFQLSSHSIMSKPISCKHDTKHIISNTKCP